MSVGERPGHILTCKCGGSLTDVRDSRPAIHGGIPIIRRRRVCDLCGKRQTTFEMTEDNILNFQGYQNRRIAAAATGILELMTSLVAIIRKDGDQEADDDGLQS